MPHATQPPDRDFEFTLPSGGNWKRLLVFWGVLVAVVLVAFLLTWNVFFKYVPPGKHLVIVAKDGGPLDPGEVLANEGQKGIQRAVKGLVNEMRLDELREQRDVQRRSRLL